MEGVDEGALEEVAPLVKGTISSVEERIRKEVEKEKEAEFAQRVNEAVDEALA